MSYCVAPPFSFLSEFFVSSPGVIGPSLLAVALVAQPAAELVGSDAQPEQPDEVGLVHH